MVLVFFLPEYYKTFKLQVKKIFKRIRIVSRNREGRGGEAFDY